MRDARERMLDSAIILFRQRGVAATSMRDIVEHGDAPRGSIYHHFPGGKEQLAREATERAGAFIASLVAGDTSIGRFLEYWRTALAAADFEDGCPVAAAALSDEARDQAGRAFAGWESTLASHLEASGKTADEASALATTAIAAVEGALLMARAQRSEEPLVRVARTLETMLSPRARG